jgi:hypothetical protein
MSNLFKEITVNAKKSFAPSKKLFHNYLIKAKKVDESYFDTTHNLSSDATTQEPTSKFEEDKKLLAQAKPYNKFNLLNPAKIFKLEKRKAEMHKYKAHQEKIAQALRIEQNIKHSNIVALNSAFSKFLHTQNPDLAQHFDALEQAENIVKNYFEQIVNPTSNKQEQAFQFMQCINQATELLIQSEVKDDSLFEKLDVLLEEFTKKYPQLSIENINQVQEKLLPLLQVRNTCVQSNNSKLSEEIDAQKQTFMQTDEAKNIQQSFAQQIQPHITTLVQNRKYKKLYMQQVASLAESLAYAGVKIDENIHQNLYPQNKVARLMLSPFEALNAAASAAYGAGSKQSKYHSAKKINHQARLIDAYLQTHSLSWQHSVKVENHTLQIQQHIENLSHKLQDKFKQSPYIKTYENTQSNSNEQEKITYIQDTQTKLDALNYKQNKRLQKQIIATRDDLQKHLAILNKEIHSLENNDVSSNKLSTVKDNLETCHKIIKRIYLMRKRIEICNNTINNLLQENQAYRNNSQTAHTNDALFSVQSNLKVLDEQLQKARITINQANKDTIFNSDDIKNIPNLFVDALNIFNQMDIEQAKFSKLDIQNENIDPSTLNTTAINNAIQIEEEAEIEDLVRQLYGTDNSKNFKIALNTYMHELNAYTVKHMQNSNITLDEVIDNLPQTQSNQENNTQPKNTLASKRKQVNVESALFNSQRKIQNWEKAILTADSPNNINIKIKHSGVKFSAAMGKFGLEIADFSTKLVSAPKKIGHFVIDASINTYKSVPWIAKETIARHGIVLNTLAKIITKPIELADTYTDKIPESIKKIATKRRNIEYIIKNKHTAKMNYGSFRGMVKFKQRDRRAKNIAKDLSKNLQFNYAINNSSDTSNVSTDNYNNQIDQLFDALRQNTRHMYETTNITGAARRQLFVADAFEGTLKQKIAEFWHKNFYGATTAEKEKVLKSFMQSYAAGKYMGKENIQMHQPEILEAFKSVIHNTNASAQFISNTILGLYIPFKLASNYVGVAAYNATGNPFILFINVPGNPVDDIIVGGSSLIISSIASIFAHIFTKEFNTNKQHIADEIHKILHPHTHLEASSIPNGVDNALTLLTQTLSAGVAKGNTLQHVNILDAVQSKETNVEQVNYAQFMVHILEQLEQKMNNELGETQKENLKALIDIVRNYNAENILNSKKAHQNYTSPTHSTNLPTAVQNMNQGIANIPGVNNLGQKNAADIKQKVNNLNPNVNFGDQIKQPTFEKLTDISYDSIDQSRIIGTPVMIPLFLAANLLASLASTTASVTQFAVDKATKIKPEERTHNWGNVAASAPQNMYNFMGKKYRQLSESNNTQDVRKGKIAGSIQAGLPEAQPRVIEV